MAFQRALESKEILLFVALGVVNHSCAAHPLRKHTLLLTCWKSSHFYAAHSHNCRLITSPQVSQDSELLEVNGEHDHVHLMVSVHPKLAISNLVGKLKGKTAYFIRQEFRKEVKKKLWGDHFWSPSYCVVSCGGASLEVVKKYIEDRKPNGFGGLDSALKQRRLRRPFVQASIHGRH